MRHSHKLSQAGLQLAATPGFRSLCGCEWLCCSGDMGTSAQDAAVVALAKPLCEAELQQGHGESWGCSGAPPGWETFEERNFFLLPAPCRRH